MTKESLFVYRKLDKTYIVLDDHHGPCLNLAISLNPDYVYAVVVNGEIPAVELVEH